MQMGWGMEMVVGLKENDPNTTSTSPSPSRSPASITIQRPALLSGNVAAAEGKQDIRIWSMEPPIPLNIRIYRCDKNFVTDVLEDMMMQHRVYGLVVMDRRDANLALLKGKTIIHLQKTHSEVPGKFKAGGQCLLPQTLVRIGKVRKKQLGDIHVGDRVLFYDLICDEMER